MKLVFWVGMADGIAKCVQVVADPMRCYSFFNFNIIIDSTHARGLRLLLELSRLFCFSGFSDCSCPSLFASAAPLCCAQRAFIDSTEYGDVLSVCLRVV